MEFASEGEPPVAFTAPADALRYELTVSSGPDPETAELTRRWQAPGDAGHFIRPPVTPTTVPWNDALVSGGTAAGNAHTQAEKWRALRGFLAAHLK